MNAPLEVSICLILYGLKKIIDTLLSGKENYI